ncbi:Nif3-like dinuclear metal center hexameric protein [soil metagenome]
MASLNKIVTYCNDLLKVDEIPDYPGALNGLQLRGAGGKVHKIAAAVDATLPVVEGAVEAGADLLVVHHGMFWGGAQRIDGAVYARLKAAMDAGLAIYSAHLPLDVHPEVGNNALLAGECGFKPAMGKPFLPIQGIEVGLLFRAATTRSALLKKVQKAVGGPVHACPGGPEKVARVGIVTGGAGGEVAAAAEAGVDTFITGEGPHWSYTLAEELGVNVFYAGHYATETFGVKALADRLARRFKCEWEFVDHPTGM